jgi:hypothetical protein
MRIFLHLIELEGAILDGEGVDFRLAQRHATRRWKQSATSQPQTCLKAGPFA